MPSSRPVVSLAYSLRLPAANRAAFPGITRTGLFHSASYYITPDFPACECGSIRQREAKAGRSQLGHGETQLSVSYCATHHVSAMQQ
ncbi:hypothetical protein BR93DRAFT_921853 [Coniochaeta sp. PMI_546]|nr:hypothetical protein BR93DRAFT_921853 [Coniochaeta sp. PMI_546]